MHGAKGLPLFPLLRYPNLFLSVRAAPPTGFHDGAGMLSGADFSLALCARMRARPPRSTIVSFVRVATVSLSRYLGRWTYELAASVFDAETSPLLTKSPDEVLIVSKRAGLTVEVLL